MMIGDQVQFYALVDRNPTAEHYSYFSFVLPFRYNVLPPEKYDLLATCGNLAIGSTRMHGQKSPEFSRKVSQTALHERHFFFLYTQGVGILIFH